MGNLLKNGEQLIASDEPAKNGYGQNGYQGQSSDLPGKITSSNFLPKAGAPSNVQTRTVSAEQLPAAHGHKGSAPGPKLGAPKNPPKR
jgi:hypothetical protein